MAYTRGKPQREYPPSEGAFGVATAWGWGERSYPYKSPLWALISPLFLFFVFSFLLFFLLYMSIYIYIYTNIFSFLLINLYFSLFLFSLPSFFLSLLSFHFNFPFVLKTRSAFGAKNVRRPNQKKSPKYFLKTAAKRLTIFPRCGIMFS